MRFTQMMYLAAASLCSMSAEGEDANVGGAGGGDNAVTQPEPEDATNSAEVEGTEQTKNSETTEDTEKAGETQMESDDDFDDDEDDVA